MPLWCRPNDQGPRAYADQMRVEHPELDRATLLTDAVLAVEQFCSLVLAGPGPAPLAVAHHRLATDLDWPGTRTR